MVSSALCYAVLLVFSLAEVSAFDYTVGVGIDETTGQPGVGFDPSSVVPAAGDHLVFEFHEGTHQVVQCTFDKPCSPMEGGFDTGIQPSGATLTLPVNDTQALWFYDAGSDLCVRGAVFSANPPLSGDETAGNFKANAMALAGTTLTTEVAPITSSAAPNGTGSASGTAPTASPSSSNGAAALVLTSVPHSLILLGLGLLTVLV